MPAAVAARPFQHPAPVPGTAGSPADALPLRVVCQADAFEEACASRLGYDADEVKAASDILMEAAPLMVGKHVVVPDDSMVRALASRVLRSAGYRVLEAETAGEALAIAETPGHHIDLVVSDVVLPEMSGPEVLRTLRRRDPGLRGVLVSGYADQTLVAKGALPPRTVFLPKPYSHATLAALVRELLDTPAP